VSVEWGPPEARPAGADAVERLIDEVAPGARVKITVGPDGWRVRALAPAAMCDRGASLAARDPSARVAEALSEAGYPIAGPRA